jgi:hypothetical protein
MATMPSSLRIVSDDDVRYELLVGNKDLPVPTMNNVLRLGRVSRRVTVSPIARSICNNETGSTYYPLRGVHRHERPVQLTWREGYYQGVSCSVCIVPISFQVTIPILEIRLFEEFPLARFGITHHEAHLLSSTACHGRRGVDGSSWTYVLLIVGRLHPLMMLQSARKAWWMLQMALNAMPSAPSLALFLVETRAPSMLQTALSAMRVALMLRMAFAAEMRRPSMLLTVSNVERRMKSTLPMAFE